MRILHCIASLRRSGAERSLVRIINHSNFKHSVFTIFNDVPLLEDLQKDIIILSLFPLKYRNLKKIYKNLKEFSPNLIQGWMYHGDFMASFLGFFIRVPVYWNIRHGRMSFKNTKKLTYFLRIILIFLSYFSPKKIISCSYCGKIVHRSIGYKKNIFEVIPNGIDHIDEEKSCFIKPSFDFENLRIGSVGRAHIQKGRDYFKNIIFNLHKSLEIRKISIIGRDVDKCIYSQNLKSNLPNLVGLIEELSELNKIYDLFNILLITSKFGEGCPNVLIESIQRGIVCFSTDVGDARYLLNDDDFIIPNDNPQKAAAQIKFILTKKNINEKILIIQKRLNKIINMKTTINKYHKAWKIYS